MFFPRSEVENGQYRLVNFRFVVMHSSAIVSSRKMMRLLRSVVKACKLVLPKPCTTESTAVYR